MAGYRLRSHAPYAWGGDRTGRSGPGHVEEPLVPIQLDRKFNKSDALQLGVKTRKGESAMAKLHARPSNQYRYEHYDPRF